MNAELLSDLARLAIQFASRSMSARQKTNPMSIALITCAAALGAGATVSFLVATWIFFEREFGQQWAPVAFGLVFLAASILSLIIANVQQSKRLKAQRAAANQEEVALQIAMLLRDHKGLVLLSALAAGLIAGTSK